ncbi:hypothetical protein B0T20DRAFT_491940 [Sordaria brevicollis]|uniref:Uncharacterized protein n=1 Tax=Sordaria brevicollis TaxID=83679 RepID=A0AAE0PJW3_SORBR|nr:hypothetical protein B0T20DRAFT_491940 [Sordaria brevicollis]
MSAYAITRKPVPSSSSEIPRPVPESEKRVRFAEWTESEGGPSAVSPTIPPIVITSSSFSGSSAPLQRPPTPGEYFDIPCPPDTFDPDDDILPLNIPSPPLSPPRQPNPALLNALPETDAESRARNNHIFAAAIHLANSLTQLEVRLGGVDLIPGLRQQASLSRLECLAFYNFLTPSDKEAFLVEQLPILATRAQALASRTEECNIHIPCLQVLNTSFGRGGGKDGQEPILWERGEGDGPPSWRDMALGAGVLAWVRRRRMVYAGPGGEKAMEDGVGGRVGDEHVALWEDLPGGPERLGRVEEGEGVKSVEGSDFGDPGFLTMWHEMLRRDDVVLRKKKELVKMMKEGKEKMEKGECRWCGERDAGPACERGGWLRRFRGR